MPAWVNSDHLTLLGFAAMLVAGVLYWAAAARPPRAARRHRRPGLNWFGDSLDGTLARVRNRLRPRYGFYVDHITDAVGTFFLMGGLALSGYMSPHIAFGLLIAYFLLSIEVYLTTYTIGAFHLSFWNFGPTELRLLLCAGNLALFFRPVVNLFGNRYLLFDVGGAVGIAGMGAMLVWSAVRHARQLYMAERLAVSPLAGRWLQFNFVGADRGGGRNWPRWRLSRVGSAWITSRPPPSPSSRRCSTTSSGTSASPGRSAPAEAPARCFLRLLRFHLGNGLVSILGNLALMRLLAGNLHLHYLAANLIAVAICSLANFLVGERWVFPATSAQAG